MPESRNYGFQDRLELSQGTAVSADIGTLLLDRIPGSISVHKAGEANDKNGVDWYVEHARGIHYGVDVKVREEDFARRGCDDLALEIWSVKERKKIGWTCDVSKRCDFILWFWVDTKRFFFVSFPLLCRAFRSHREWMDGRYKRATQKTPMVNGRSYTSECVFVPRQVVVDAINDVQSGCLSADVAMPAA